MAFEPLELLLAYDDAQGRCGRVVPDMRRLLEQRAFVVHELVLDDSASPVDLTQYDGVILGTPSFGLGWRGVGPSERVTRWLQAQGALDQLRVAVFCVYDVRPGYTLRNTRQLVLDQGGEVVVSQAYSSVRPDHDAHVLPAECMVRIR